MIWVDDGVYVFYWVFGMVDAVLFIASSAIVCYILFCIDDYIIIPQLVSCFVL